LAPSIPAVAGSGLAAVFGVADAAGFNGFDAGLCESLGAATALVLVAAVLAGLGDFLATAFGAFLGALALAFALAPGVLAAALAALRTGFAAAGFAADVLPGWVEDFLRVFLDIRLPFVAFRRSINRVLRVLSRAVGFASAAGQV